MKTIILVLLLSSPFFYLTSLDLRVLEGLLAIRNPAFTLLAFLFAFLGSWRFLVPFNLLFAFFFRKKKPFALLIPLGTLSCWVLNHLIKELIQRQRPPIAALAIENSFSFPSGHAMVSSCFILLLFIFIKKTWDKDFLVPAAIYIGLMALSRLYLGVHYPSDVLVGSALGLAYAWALYQYFGGKYDRSNHKG